MGSSLRWWFRPWTSCWAVKGAFPGALWMSRWAALARAWTPVSVRLEMWNLMGALGFSFWAASCKQQKGVIQELFSNNSVKNILLLAKNASGMLPGEFGVAVGWKEGMEERVFGGISPKSTDFLTSAPKSSHTEHPKCHESFLKCIK